MEVRLDQERRYWRREMSPAELEIKFMLLTDLSSDPANARLHSDRNIEAVVGSLRRFGQQKPIVIDSDGIIRAGNGTFQAATKLGWEKIAVVQTDLEGAEATAYAIADNRAGELATWDQDVLARSLLSLRQGEDGAEGLDGTGFSDGDLQALFGELPPSEDADGNSLPSDEFGGDVTSTIGDSMTFSIVVSVADEMTQSTLIERLESEGYVCRALML